MLIAIVPILFENTQYEPGDELPLHQAELVAVWTENGAAEWRETLPRTNQVAKAKRITAEPGLPGIATPSAGQELDLPGKVPTNRVPSGEKKKGRKQSDTA